MARFRHGPGRRLTLTLVALATLITGYYLGQRWQRLPLTDLSALVYPNGMAIDYPDAIAARITDDARRPWRLFVTGDTRAPACRALLKHYALVINRLAPYPAIQSRLRLSMLAFDTPTPDVMAEFRAGLPWVDVIEAPADQLDRFSAELGIRPVGSNWCEPTQANAILVSPGDVAWALIPYGQAAIMAHDIRTLIDFVE